VPAPDGTTINLNYFLFGHEGAFKTTSGTSVPNSHSNLYLGVERLLHYDYVFGHPAGFLLSQAFGGISDAKVGGESVGTTNGVSNTTLAAAFWPYANFEQKQYLVLVG
jgi:hypothetical protein